MNLSKRIRTYLLKRNKTGTRVGCSDQIEIQLGILSRKSYQNIHNQAIKSYYDTFTDPEPLPYQSSANRIKSYRLVSLRIQAQNDKIFLQSATISQSTISYDLPIHDQLRLVNRGVRS